MNKIKLFVVLTLMLALFSAGIGIAAAADPIISIVPPQSPVYVGDDFDVYIQVDPNGNTLEMTQVDLTFDSSFVSLTVADGDMFGMFDAGTQSGDTVTDISGVDSGVSTTGNLAVLHMHAKSAGTFTIDLSGVTAATGTAALTPDVHDGTVTVESGTTGDPISATRDISDQTVEPGSTFTVTLTLTANEDNVQAPALKENLPADWTVTEMDNAGATYKPSTTEWVWSAAMSSGETKTVTYQVTVPASATPGDYYITGYVSAHEVGPFEIGGESKVTVRIAAPPPPPPPPSEVPILTSAGMCALIAVLGIVGAGIVNRGGRKS